MGEQQSDHIKFRCQCEAKLKVPKSAIGKRVACPKCGFKMTVPGGPAPAAPVAASKPAPEPQLPEGLPSLEPDKEEDSFLDDLMQLEQSAEATQQVSFADKQKECPKCKVQLAASAQTCLACGYDLNAPKVKKAKKDKSKPRAASAYAGASHGAVARSTGRLVLGCFLSCVGAMIGAGIWIVVAVFGVELGIVAIGIGALAGLGMVIGFGEQTPFAGKISAVIAFLGFLGGKLGIYGILIGLAAAVSLVDIVFQRMFLANYMTKVAMDSSTGIPDHEWDAEWEDRFESISQQVFDMSQEEVTLRYDEIDKNGSISLNANADQKRLGGYRAMLESNRRGLFIYGKLRTKIWEDEVAKVMELSNGDLKIALAELDKWEDQGRWDSPDYVTDYLVIHMTTEAMGDSKKPDDFMEYDAAREAAKWKRLYDKNLAEVKDISPEEQLERVKSIVAEEESYGIDYSSAGESLIDYEGAIEFEEGADELVAEAKSGMMSSISFFDLLWLALVLSTAYKIGSRNS